MKLNETLGEVRIAFQVKRLIPISILVLFLMSYSYFLGFNPWKKIELNDFKTTVEKYKDSSFEECFLYGNIETKNHNLTVSSLFSIDEDMVIYRNFFLLLIIIPILFYLPGLIEWVLSRLFKENEKEKERLLIIQELTDIILGIILLFLILNLNGIELILYMLRDVSFPFYIAIIPLGISIIYFNDLCIRIRDLKL